MIKWFKHMTITFIWISFPSLLIGQNILTKANHPEINIVLTYNFQDTTGILPGNSGANVIWDFSGLVQETDDIKISFTDPNEALLSSYYPNANQHVIDSNNHNSKYKKVTIDSVLIHGIINPNAETKWKYSDTELINVFPFHYNETFQDTFIAQQTHVDFGHSGEPAYRNGMVQVTYDAFGQLILPNGITFDSVIRIETIETYQDSICVYCSIGIDRIDDVVTTKYTWYVDTIDHPILEMVSSDITINGSIKNYKKEVKLYHEFSEIYTPIESNFSDHLKIYPNPTSGKTDITSNQTIKSIDLINNTGKILLSILKYDNSDQPIMVDITNYPSGIYILKVTYNSGESCYKKLIRE